MSSQPLSTLRSLRIDPDKAAAELCRRYLSYFVKEFWDIVVPNDLVWNWHLDALCDEIQAADERVFLRQPKEYDLIINIPPGTSKTKIVSIMSTAWEFARMPSIKVFVGSYSDSAVASISDEIKIIMKSEKYKRFFPDVEIRKDRDSLHNFRTTDNGEFYAFTVGGTLTSKHADILKVDDPLNPKQAASEAELKSANDFFDKTLPTRKVDKKVTPTYLIMQRLHTNDPTGHILEKKKGEGIRHICLPGTLSKNVSPVEYREMYIDGYLDPVRLGPSELAELKIDLGSEAYAGQIDQSPVPEGGLIWKKWFMEIPDEDWPLAKWGQSLSTDWDLAYTKDDDNAASAYVTTFKYRNKIFIEDYDWKWLEFPELVRWMKTIQAPHYIEAKASGKSAKQTLGQSGVIAVEYQLKGTGDKKARARMATPVAEAGMVCIRKSMADRIYNDPKQGILFFPRGQFMDLADALAQAIQRQSGGGVRMLGASQSKDELEALGY